MGTDRTDDGHDPGSIRLQLPSIDDPVGAKLAWAYQHLKQLDLHFIAFANSFQQGRDYELVGEIDQTTGEEVHRLARLRVPTFQWELLLSEVVHLMRSALDNVVERITIGNTGAPMPWTGFPVFESEDRFRGRQGERGSGLFMIRGLRPEQQIFIEGLQPFHAGRDREVKDNLLWLVHELWNMDKHRTPPVGLAGAVATDVRFASGLTRDATLAVTFPLKKGIEIIRFANSGDATRPRERVELRILPMLNFADDSPGFGRPLVPLLDQAHILISRVVRRLDPTTTMEIEASEIEWS